MKNACNYRRFVIMFVALVSGCAYSNRHAPADGVAALKLKTLERSEYVILKTVEGSGETGSIFCFSTGDDQFGYVTYSGRSAIGLADFAPRKDAVAAATYNALSKIPDADLILPLTTTTSYSGIPCFNSQRATVRGKAIRILGDGERKP